LKPEINAQCQFVRGSAQKEVARPVPVRMAPVLFGCLFWQCGDEQSGRIILIVISPHKTVDVLAISAVFEVEGHARVFPIEIEHRHRFRSDVGALLVV